MDELTLSLMQRSHVKVLRTPSSWSFFFVLFRLCEHEQCLILLLSGVQMVLELQTVEVSDVLSPHTQSTSLSLSLFLLRLVRWLSPCVCCYDMWYYVIWSNHLEDWCVLSSTTWKTVMFERLDMLLNMCVVYVSVSVGLGLTDMRFWKATSDTFTYPL